MRTSFEGEGLAGDHDDVFPLVLLGHLVVSTIGVFAESCTRREPLKPPQNLRNKVQKLLLTSEAASSVRDDTYRVAITLSPSVTQKFIRLG